MKKKPRQAKMVAEQWNPARSPAVAVMSDEEIERSSPPELANLPDDFWDDAVVVPPAIKLPISLRVDEDVLDWFREQGAGYQTRMNAVLRSYMTRMRAKPAAKTSARGRKR